MIIRHTPDPPPRWRNDPLVLYHGTLFTRYLEIARDGIQVGRGRDGTDLGRGFYATLDRDQAMRWATRLAAGRKDKPVVAFAGVSRDDLASLECLFFVRGDEGADDFWSFVFHCRRGAKTHARRGGQRTMYDVVAGPVSRNYHLRSAYENMDQICFHTGAAEQVLNSVPWSCYDPGT